MATSLLLLLSGMQSANAAGFYIGEQGTPGSMGTAGVANVTNTFTADAAWTNPAGMTGMTEDSILTGMVVAVSNMEFNPTVAERDGSDGGNAADVGVIPSIFYTKVLSERSRFGFSIAAPFGGGVDYGDDFVGRYAVQNVTLESLAFTPSYAYKVNDKLSVGVGISIINSKLEQDIAVNRTALLPDGKAKFEDMEDWGYQAIVGLTYQATSRTLIGVVYRSESDVNLEGTLRFEGMPILNPPDQNVTIQWDNPQSLEAGVRHKLNDKNTLFMNLGWEEWSAFSNNKLAVTTTGFVDITDRNWDDTWKAGIAYAYKLNDSRRYTLGLLYESSPVKDQFRTFDFPVTDIWKLGGAYTWKGSSNFDYAVGATLYLLGDAPVDQTEQGVRAAGGFDNFITLFIGGTLRYTF
jgi:long-chain fatty acid transport protein